MKGVKRMIKKVFPVIVEKGTENILPLISAKFDDEGNMVEVEVWKNDDIFYLQEDEFEIVPTEQGF